MAKVLLNVAAKFKATGKVNAEACYQKAKEH
jgi:hypothetical protein